MFPRPRPKMRGSALQYATLPAPIGLDTISSGSAMSPDRAIRIYNMLRREYGLGVRSGWREWCTGLLGGADNTVRTIIEFTGSEPSKDKLFAVTSAGIWDVTDTSTNPTLLLGFDDLTGRAGYGISAVVATQAGHFALYTDEVNGYYLYSESTTTWSKIVKGTNQAWAGNTSYNVNDKVRNGANAYICTVAGISAASGGPVGVGAGIVDGTATWNFDYAPGVGAVSIGPSLSDQHAGLDCDPANFVFCTAWKNRLYFVEKNSTRAWYLDLLANTGLATSLTMGLQFKTGGYLIGLWSWSMDGGSGIDDRLIAISSGGDVVIFAGTDPSSAFTFGVQGTWSVGAVPAGRRIATKYGGDVLILSKAGIFPVSGLMAGRAGVDKSQYATEEISPLFNAYALSYGDLWGWSMTLHPEDSALIVTVPSGDGLATNQLVMSLSTKGWSEYRNLSIYSCDVWEGKFYFGTPDGKVCVHTGYIDGVTLADPNSYTPIQFRVLYSFQNLGSPLAKKIQLVRPKIICDAGSVGYETDVKYDYDFSGYNMLDGVDVAQAVDDGWDTDTWDSGVWGGDYSMNQSTNGAVGMGVDVAIGIRGAAISRTILIGVDVGFVVGGFL